MASTWHTYRPDRVLWRWVSGQPFPLDGVQRCDCSFFRACTRDYDSGEFVYPPRTLRAEIRRDVSEIQREFRERRGRKVSRAPR